MNKEPKYTLLWPIIGLGFSLAFPSMNQVQKYLGIAGILLYIPIIFLVLLVIRNYCIKRFISRFTEKQVLRLAAITFLSLIVIFFIVYPVVNLGVVGGGSDRDDDATIATKELVLGHYPYYPRTYLGNTITHLPGSLLLSIPFVLLGNSAYQNFFWLFVFFYAVSSYLKNRHLALLLLWAILFLSPVVLQEFVTGGDFLSNSIYILFFILFMVNSVLESGAKHWQKILSAILLGIGLSSRLNYILLLPLVFSALAQNSDCKTTAKYICLTCFIFLVVTVPFYLYDPKNFTPLYGQFNKINQFHNILPFSGILISFVGGVISLALSFQRLERNCITLFKNCMFVQVFLILCAVVLDTMQRRRLSFNFTGYGFSFLFFGAIVYWSKLSEGFTLWQPAKK